jgi:hypothetical protein
MSEVTSLGIKNALAKKHRREFFITECKTGPTTTGLYKFDGIAIYKSWTRPQIRGYEIKISRSDFLGDNKFYNYLPYCHEMYFVVPTGLIDRAEIPTEIGLINYNPKTGGLNTKKKAIYRNIEINADMLFYIFMNRIDGDKPQFTSDKAEFFKAWLENKESNRRLADQVKNRMTKEIKRLEDELRRADIDAEYKKELDEIDKVLYQHGERGYHWNGGRAEAIKRLLTKRYPSELDNLQRQLQDAAVSIDQIKKAYEDGISAIVEIEREE